jgi:hypothetical protein
LNPLYLEPVFALLVDGNEVVSVVRRAVRLVLEGALLRQQADVDAGEVDGSRIRVIKKFFRKVLGEIFFFNLSKFMKCPPRAGHSVKKFILCILSIFCPATPCSQDGLKTENSGKFGKNSHLTL